MRWLVKLNQYFDRCKQFAERLLTAVGEAAVGDRVKNSLVRILLRSHKDQVLEGMRATRIVEDLGDDGKVALNEGPWDMEGVSGEFFVFQVGYSRVI